jgi:hypothetical protein
LTACSSSGLIRKVTESYYHDRGACHDPTLLSSFDRTGIFRSGGDVIGNAREYKNARKLQDSFNISMAPVLSYIIFTASAKFKQDRAHYRDALEKIFAFDGIISSWDGLQIQEEDSKLGHIASLWNSPWQLQTFWATKGAEFQGILDAVAEGEVQRYEFAPSKRSFAPALDRIVTEYATSWPKAGVDKEAVKESAIKVSDAIEAVGHPSAVGEDTKAGKFLFVGGWDSQAQHLAATKNPPFPTILGEFVQLADFAAAHVNFTKHSIKIGTRLL